MSDYSKRENPKILELHKTHPRVAGGDAEGRLEGQNWTLSPIFTLKNTPPAAAGGGERRF